MPKKVPPTIDFPALVEDASLLSIATYAVEGRRYQTAAAETDEILSNQFLEMGTRDDGMGFRVRIKSELAHGDATAMVDVGAEYELAKFKAADIPRDALVQFVNDVAVMQIVPYLRQGLADLTLRVWDDAITLPVMQRGQMNFAPADFMPEVEATKD